MSSVITYLDHSGFSVAVGGHILIFDYYNDSADRRELASGVITRAELMKYDRVSVFASHSHSDHFNPVIFGWSDSVRADYYLSYEIDAQHSGHRLSPGDALETEGMTVRAYGSTDLGVSFLVETAGWRVFHAGDLNWWHWREESTPKEIEESERYFKQEMEPIIQEAKRDSFDIAFFPLDPRQKTFADVGANYFIHCVKPRNFVPMHTMGKGEFVLDYARRTQQKGTRVLPMNARGQQVEIEDKEE